MKEKSFKEYVLKQDRYEPSKFRFLGQVRPDILVHLLSMSDLHIYLTVPFVLSWSMLDAMACARVVLGSDTAPVREVITDGENGLLRNFFDVEGLAAAVVDVLKDPDQFRDLGRAAEATIAQRYSLDVVLPRMTALYEEVAG